MCIVYRVIIVTCIKISSIKYFLSRLISRARLKGKEILAGLQIVFRKKHEVQFNYVNLNPIIRYYISPLILQLKGHDYDLSWKFSNSTSLLCCLLRFDVVILWWVLKVMCKVTSKLAYSKFCYINQSRVVFYIGKSFIFIYSDHFWNFLVTSAFKHCVQNT